MANFKGVLFGILTATTFGLIPLFTLPLMAKGMHYPSILFYRFLFGALCLFGMMKYKKESFRVREKDFMILFFLGLCYVGSALFLFWGYNLMPAGIATTLHFTYPIFVTLLVTLVFRDRISKVVLCAIPLAVGGVAVLSIGDTSVKPDFVAILIVLLSAVAYGLYIVTVNKSRVRGMNGRKLTFYVFLVSTFFFFIQAQASGGVQHIPDAASFGNLFFLAVFPTVVSNIMLVKAIQHIGSTLTSVLGACEPVTAVLIGIFVFNEPFSNQIATGILLILLSVVLILLAKPIQKRFFHRSTAS